MSKATKVRAAVVASVVVVGALCISAVVAARGGPTNPEDLEAAIASEPLVKVLDLPSAEGAAARAMFVQSTSAGFVCVWDAPSPTSRLRQGQCTSSDDPLGGRAVSASLAYDGGPAIDGVEDARLIGLASQEAASVNVLMSDGSARALRLRRTKVGSDAFQAFAYRFKKVDLRNGIGPTAIVAYDAGGAEIGRQPTGIG
jgi:hypothetical protein